jgi:phospholipase D-like protein
MVIAADYPFLDILGTMLIFFAWVIWFYLLIIVFSDLIRRHDVSGWAKAGWTLLLIVLPFIGVLIYLGTQGKEMAERTAKDAKQQQQQFDSYVKDVAGGPAQEIATAQGLLDKGSITQTEFDQIKTRALAAA